MDGCWDKENFLYDCFDREPLCEEGDLGKITSTDMGLHLLGNAVASVETRYGRFALMYELMNRV